MDETHGQQTQGAGDEGLPDKFDLLRLEGHQAASKRSRIGVLALAALLLAGGVWSARASGAPQAPQAPQVTRAASGQFPAAGELVAASSVSRGGTCFAPISATNPTGVLRLDDATEAQLRRCIRHLKSLEQAVVWALAERSGSLVHEAVRDQPAASECQGMPATADAAERWISSGHFPDCAR
jgi:hypothetical protein